MYKLPKSYMISSILDIVDLTEVRKYFKFKNGTDVKSRLNSLTKIQLSEFIDYFGGELADRVRSKENSFPLESSASLYIINVPNSYSFSEVSRITIELSEAGRNKGLINTDDKSIRAVYFRQPIVEILNDYYEGCIGYEKRVLITEWDPSKEEYGKQRYEYTLKNALVWLSRSLPSYGIIACNDFYAVPQIIKYLNTCFNLNIHAPELTENMLQKISYGSNAKNATFTKLFEDNDVKTITIYDEQLSKREMYRDLTSSGLREQRAGFYTNHPDLLRAGIGISRSYGKIWTPAYLERSELIKLSSSIIIRLDKELKTTAENDYSQYISYYSNSKVFIDGTELTGTNRSFFDKFIGLLVACNKTSDKKLTLSNEHIRFLVKKKNKFKMDVAFVFDCPNCGEIKLKCPTCNKNLTAIIKDNELKEECKKCNITLSKEEYKCDCGESIQVLNIYNNLVLIPGIEFLDAVNEYAKLLHPNVVVPDLFMIKGESLIVFIKSSQDITPIVYLSQLKYWNVRAHYNSLTADKDLLAILRKLKEKCNINKYHPKSSDCEKCSKKTVTEENYNNKEMCLLRAFGIPINQYHLDGIHNGNEKADILYEDMIDDKSVTIGIHVKSRKDYKRTEVLSRTKSIIRELFTQLFFTLYKTSKGDEKYDVLGIAIPNKLKKDVVDSMQRVVNHFGISFIYIDEDEWLKIIQSNINIAQFNS